MIIDYVIIMNYVILATPMCGRSYFNSIFLDNKTEKTKISVNSLKLQSSVSGSVGIQIEGCWLQSSSTCPGSALWLCVCDCVCVFLVVSCDPVTSSHYICLLKIHHPLHCLQNILPHGCAVGHLLSGYTVVHFLNQSLIIDIYFVFCFSVL